MRPSSAVAPAGDRSDERNMLCFAKSDDGTSSGAPRGSGSAAGDLLDADPEAGSAGDHRCQHRPSDRRIVECPRNSARSASTM